MDSPVISFPTWGGDITGELPLLQQVQYINIDFQQLKSRINYLRFD
jgi:hypothetical protein